MLVLPQADIAFKLFVPQSRIDARKYFFCHRVVRCWNSLPAQPDDFFPLNNFKRLLERTDLSSFAVIDCVLKLVLNS